MVNFENFVITNYDELIALLKSEDMYYEDWESKDSLQKKIKRDPESIILAKENQKIIGCIFIMEDGIKGSIWRLCVHPDFRKKGIGSKLVKTAEDVLKSREIKDVFFLVNPKKDYLIDWYKKQNYIRGREWTYMYKSLK